MIKGQRQCGKEMCIQGEKEKEYEKEKRKEI